MEKKKLLLVAVSVGVVLLILICIPLIALTGQSRPAHASAPVDTGYYRPPFAPPEQPPAFEDEPELPPHLSEAPPEEHPQAAPAEAPQPEPRPVATIVVPAPTTAAVPDAPVIRQAPRPAAPRPAAPAQAAPAASPAPAASTAQASAPQQAAPARAAQPSAARTGATNYWVQTGALSTKVRAEGAKDLLEAKGVTSIIENSNIDGRTWYRVRVGPYVSQTEANYWLALVQSIDGFGGSQIRQTQAVR